MRCASGRTSRYPGADRSAKNEACLPCPRPRSGGAECANLDRLAMVRPARTQAVTVHFALRDGARGRSSSTRSCITFGAMRPRSPRSRRTRPLGLHRRQRARPVRLGLAGGARQRVERAHRLLRDDAQQLAIASRVHLGEGLCRSEPDFRLIGCDAALTIRPLCDEECRKELAEMRQM